MAKPKTSNLLLHTFISVGVLSAGISGYLAVDKIGELSTIVEKQDKNLREQKNEIKKLDSIIEENQKEILDVKEENKNLKIIIEQKEKEKQEIIDTKSKEIEELNNKNKELSNKLSTLPSRGESASSGKEIYMQATGYTAYCNGCSGTTATGINLRSNPNQKVIAVDPKIIPLGTKVHVEGYGYAVAADTGGAIKGNKIDLFFPEKQTAINWGRQNVKVKILD